MLAVVTKPDAQITRRLSAAETAAVRAAASDRADRPASGLAQSLLRTLREQERWLACDCRREGRRLPLLAPCRLPFGLGHTLRVLTGPHRIAHDRSCVFYRAEKRIHSKKDWERAARVRPSGLFTVLRPQGSPAHL